jgi:hypothetical protein
MHNNLLKTDVFTLPEKILTGKVIITLARKYLNAVIPASEARRE